MMTTTKELINPCPICHSEMFVLEKLDDQNHKIEYIGICYHCNKSFLITMQSIHVTMEEIPLDDEIYSPNFNLN